MHRSSYGQHATRQPHFKLSLKLQADHGVEGCNACLAETDEMDESLPEVVLLDENAEAAKHSFYMVGGER